MDTFISVCISGSSIQTLVRFKIFRNFLKTCICCHLLTCLFYEIKVLPLLKTMMAADWQISVTPRSSIGATHKDEPDQLFLRCLHHETQLAGSKGQSSWPQCAFCFTRGLFSSEEECVKAACFIHLHPHYVRLQSNESLVIGPDVKNIRIL